MFPPTREFHFLSTHDFLLAVVLTAAVRGRHGGGALLEVPRLRALLGRARDGQREDGVGIPVAVARVRLAAAVARRPDEDGAASPATLKRDNEKETLIQFASVSSWLFECV